jgi:hypothetical protein
MEYSHKNIYINYFLGGSSNTTMKNIKPTSLWAIGALLVFNKEKCIQNEEEKCTRKN